MSEFNHSNYSGEFGDLASDIASANAAGTGTTNAAGVLTIPTVTVTADGSTPSTDTSPSANGIPLPIMIGGGILAGGLLFWMINREG